jgi:hypothetical protein
MVFPSPQLGFGLVLNYLEGDMEGLQFVYGGARGEWVIFPEFAVSPSFAFTAGGGALYPAYSEAAGDRATGVIVLEPEVNVAVGILPDLQLSLGAGYRLAIAPGPGDDGFQTADLSAPTIIVHLREGHFQDSGSMFYPKSKDPGKGRKHLPRELKPDLPFIISGFYDSTFTTFGGEFARMDGGGTRIIFNKRVAIGATGAFLASETYLNGKRFAAMETGLWSEYVFNPFSILQVSVGGITGVGMYGWYDGGEVTGGPAFLINPELFLTLFTADFIKVAAGCGYRFVAGSSLSEVADTDLWGVTGSLHIRLGGF